MTPCEERGYKVGQVFERVNCSNGTNNGTIMVGDILVLHGTFGQVPDFLVLTGNAKGFVQGNNLDSVKRIYPPEEKKTETIELMGKTYNKAEIEEALSNVLPV